MEAAAPSLDELNSCDRAAWLWDAARCRIVWANRGGLAFFSCETLFDLIDRPFDRFEPGVDTLWSIAENLNRGEVRQANLAFPSAAFASDVPCDCSIHSLSDGRAGLLIIARDNSWRDGSAKDRLMVGVLDAMPMAIVVTRADGETIYANEAAHDMIAEDRRSSLAVLTDSAEVSADLLNLTSKTRTASQVLAIATRFGIRQVRVTARRLDAGDREGVFLFMLDDVTDRRALEKSMAQGQHTPVPQVDRVGAKSEKPATATLDRQDVIAFERLSAAANQTASAAATTDEQAGQEGDIPQIVRQALERIARPAILHKDGQFVTANDAAAQALGYTSPADLAARADLITIISTTDNLGIADLTDATGSTLRFGIVHQLFPWRDGPATQTTLEAVFADPTEPPAPVAVEGAGVSPAPAPASQPVLGSTLPHAAAAEQSAGRKEPASPAYDAASRRPVDEDLKTIVDTATDGVVTLDEAGGVTSLSASAEAMFGRRIADVVGKPFSDMLTEDSRATLKDYLSALSDGGIASVFHSGREVTALSRQGGSIPMFMTMGRLAGSPPRFCAVLRDITQWKKTESELRQAKDDAVDASSQKSRFLAQISHELRTPLNAILGFSDVMRTERFGEIANDKYLAYANDIHNSGSHLLSLINDLLDLSKVEAGQLELNFTSVSLASLIDEAMTLMQDQATAARVVLRKDIPPGLPSVVADQRSMKQILFNLLSNAIKFTDPGGQAIASLKLNTAGELTLKVKDTGIGMNADELAKALKPFQRVENAKRDRTQGTGLGLPLTKALAEANRARFAISSERRKGTLISITFPTTRVLAE